MNPYPVIPENVTNHDVSNILIDEFQTPLSKPLFPKNISKNVIKYECKEIFNLNDIAGKVQEFENVFNDETYNLDAAEGLFMSQQAIYEEGESKLKKEICAKEKLLIKNDVKVFQDIDTEIANNYGLIQKRDLLSHIVERTLDFRFTDRHLKVKNKKLKDKFNKLPKGTCPPYIKPRKGQIEILENRSDTNIENEIKWTEERALLKKKKEIESKMGIILETPIIFFRDCKFGQIYKKTAVIRNMSKFPHLFQICTSPKNNNLKAYTKSTSNSMTPTGIKFKISIDLKITRLNNFEDCVKVSNEIDQIFEIPIKVECKIISLELSLIKSPEDITKKSVFAEHDLWTINDELLVDCGCCLVKDMLINALVLKNIGNTGKFCILSEEEWKSNEIMVKNNYITTDNFVVYPRYFEILDDETDMINIVFRPTNFEKIIENFVLITDGGTKKMFSVRGAGMLFCKEFIKVAIRGKRSCSDFNSCRSLEITKEGLIFDVINSSPIYLKYYWSARTGVLNSTEKQLGSDWISIGNDIPFLPPHSVSTFNLYINPPEYLNGSLITLLGFYIQSIPIQSLEENEEFIIAHSKFPDCDVVGHVDVLVEEEIKLVYKDYNFIQGSDSHAHETDNNTGLDSSTDCAWHLPSVDGDVLSEVDSESHTLAYVVDYDAYPNVTPFSEEIAATCTPKIRFLNQVVNLGVVPVGAEFKKKIQIQNDTNHVVKWRIYEIMYDSKESALCICSKCNIHPTSGTLKPRQQKNTTYTVLGKKSIRFASLLVLQSFHEENFTLESFCIIAYERIKLDINIKTQHPSLPIICPFDFLYPNVEAVYNVSIINKSILKGTFAFLKPYGKDADKVDINVTPSSGVVQKLKHINVQISIIPKETGILDEIYVPCFVGLNHCLLKLRIMIVVDTVHVYLYLPRINFFDKIKWPKIRKEKYDLCLCGEGVDFNYDDSTESLVVKHETDIVEKYKLSSSSSEEEIKANHSTNTFDSSELKSAYLKICQGVDESPAPCAQLSFRETEDSLIIVTDLKEELRKQFGKNIILQENVIELRNIKLKTRMLLKCSYLFKL